MTGLIRGISRSAAAARTRRLQKGIAHRDRGEISLALASGTVLVLLLPVLLLSATSGIFRQAGSCTAQPAPTSQAQHNIPAAYLTLYKQAGQHYRIPWEVLAGIGKVESDHGQSNAPGVHSGANAAGAAGPMQIGIRGAAGNTWGGAPTHPASQHTGGYGIDGDHNGTVNVYDPGDAIPSAAGFLRAHGAPASMQAALTAYNHSPDYAHLVLRWAARYAGGSAQLVAAMTSPACTPTANGPLSSGSVEQIVAYAKAQLSNPHVFYRGPGGEITLNPRACPAQEADRSSSIGPAGAMQAGLDVQQQCAAAAVILYASAQLGKPYQWGGTGPDAFDCSGLAMMAYRAAGITIPRTSQQQWLAGTRIPPGQEQPGDLVFFAGSDGTSQAPGHVGIVIGNGEMIEAYATGYPIRISTYGQPTSPPGDEAVVGFDQPL